MNGETTNWHKVMLWGSTSIGTSGVGLLTAAAATAKEADFPVRMIAFGVMMVVLAGFGLYLTRPSQTSAKIEKISDAIPGNPKTPMFPPANSPPAA
jgi:hypothetical protein